jgi:hypothetical protein
MLIEEMRAQWVNHRIAEFDKELRNGRAMMKPRAVS